MERLEIHKALGENEVAVAAEKQATESEIHTHVLSAEEYAAYLNEIGVIDGLFMDPELGSTSDGHDQTSSDLPENDFSDQLIADAGIELGEIVGFGPSEGEGFRREFGPGSGSLFEQDGAPSDGSAEQEKPELAAGQPKSGANGNAQQGNQGNGAGPVLNEPPSDQKAVKGFEKDANGQWTESSGQHNNKDIDMDADANSQGSSDLGEWVEERHGDGPQQFIREKPLDNDQDDGTTKPEINEPANAGQTTVYPKAEQASAAAKAKVAEAAEKAKAEAEAKRKAEEEKRAAEEAKKKAEQERNENEKKKQEKEDVKEDKENDSEGAKPEDTGEKGITPMEGDGSGGAGGTPPPEDEGIEPLIIPLDDLIFNTGSLPNFEQSYDPLILVEPEQASRYYGEIPEDTTIRDTTMPDPNEDFYSADSGMGIDFV